MSGEEGDTTGERALLLLLTWLCKTTNMVVLCECQPREFPIWLLYCFVHVIIYEIAVAVKV